MDKLSPLTSLQPSPFNNSPDINQQFSPNRIQNSSQQFPISLPPIKEGYSNYKPGNEINSRRFSLPSINSFDQPTPPNMCSVGFRKMSLPTSSFQGFHPSNSLGFLPEGTQNDSEMHACQYPGCYWSFKRNEHLKRHMTVHTQERPYLCTYPNCNRDFSRSDNLNVHYRTHFDPNSSNRELNYEDVLKRQTPSLTINPSAFKKNIEHPYSGCQKVPKIKFQNITFASYSSGPRLPSISHNESRDPVTLPSIDEIASQSENSFEPQLNNSCIKTEINRNFHSRYSKSYNYPSPLEQLANVASISYMAPIKPSVDTLKTQAIRPKLSETDSKLIWTDLDDEGRQIKYYVCQFKGCNMKFKRSEHLTRHRLVHTMERPFSCTHPGCNKAFSRADNLRQHTRIHTRPHPGHVGHTAFNTIRIANSTPYLKNQNELASSQGFSYKS